MGANFNALGVSVCTFLWVPTKFIWVLAIIILWVLCTHKSSHNTPNNSDRFDINNTFDHGRVRIIYSTQKLVFFVA